MKPSGAMRFPWSGRDVPHAVLDLLRTCNIECEGCYNARSFDAKPLAQVCRELDCLRTARRLHTVTISGGEPTQHPGLAEIVRYASGQGLKVALLTNGVGLSEARLRPLRDAGLSVVLLHIQSGQKRPDLPDDAAPADVRELRAEKARVVAGSEIEVGLSIVAYRSRLDEVRRTVGEVLASPLLNHLLVTEFTDFSRFDGLTGNLEQGLKAPAPAAGAAPHAEEVRNDDIARLLASMCLYPYGYLGCSHDPAEARWLSYLVGVVRDGAGGTVRQGLRPGVSDRVLTRMARLTTGRYPFFFKSAPWLFRLQLSLNAVSGGHAVGNARLLAASLRRGARLIDKHLVFQEGPTLAADGALRYCRECPDATVVDGRLVPLCVADRVGNASQATRERSGG